MLFIATLLYYPLKYFYWLRRMFIFLIYPIGLIIKALQIHHDRNTEEESNRTKKLIMVVVLFVIYSIIEKIFSQFDSKFFLLLFMIGGMVLAKDRGYFDQGLKKVEELVAKIKKVWL